jgi:hypothetical protein
MSGAQACQSEMQRNEPVSENCCTSYHLESKAFPVSGPCCLDEFPYWALGLARFNGLNQVTLSLAPNLRRKALYSYSFGQVRP